jgi:hypothetical protein
MRGVVLVKATENGDNSSHCRSVLRRWADTMMNCAMRAFSRDAGGLERS